MGERNQHMEKLPGILVKLRNQKGVTQREAAEAMGITFGVLSNYEKGQKAPSLDFAYKMADYYGVSLDALCGRENPEKGTPVDMLRSFLSIRENANGLQELSFEDVPWRKSKEPAFMGEEIDYEMEEDENPGKTVTLKCVTWTIHNNRLAQFMESYEQLSSLVEKGQLDRSVLDIWLEKQLSDASTTSW